MPKPVDDSKMWDAFVEERKTVVEQHETKILEAYKNGQVSKEQLIEEGLWDRMKARSGSVMQNLGSKALSSVGNKLGNTRMGTALKTAGEAGQTDVQEQRASQLMQQFSQKIDKMYTEMKSDAKALGIDIDKLAQNDYASKGTGGSYPKLAGLSQFLRHINDSRRMLSTNTP